MRKLLIVAIAGMLGVVSAAPVAAGTVIVLEGAASFPDDLAAVQDAVDTAHEVILEGTFDFGDGTLIISRNVTLRGRHDATILNGGLLSDVDLLPAILATQPATDVTIRDLSMEGAAYSAIETDGVPADISGNRVALGPDGERGILVLNGDGSRVRRNAVSTPAGIGIEVAYSNTVDVRNNTVESEDFGIILVDSTSGLTVVNNVVEAEDGGIGLLGVSDSAIINNAVSIVGFGTGPFNIGSQAVGLYFWDTFSTVGNRIRNNSISGEMVYGYVFAETVADNEVFIAPTNLDEATFVTPPFFGLCGNGPGEPHEGGATVVFSGATIFGPAAEGNTIENRAESATFLDCGIDNTVR